MKNREIYPKDPSIRKLVNEGVASVNDEQTTEALAVLRYELETFVCDGQYAKAIEHVLENYLKNIHQAQQAAVWIAGFFGSGKSHLVKMLRALWTDVVFPDGATARSIAILPQAIRHLLKELSTQGKRHGGLHAASGTLGAGASGSVRLALLRIIFKSAGLPEQYPLARFVLWLRAEGIYDQVRQLVESTGYDWQEELDNFYVAEGLHEALVQAKPKLFSSAAACVETLNNLYPFVQDISSDEMVKAIRQALTVEGKFPLTLIVLDEVQQFIGNSDTQRSLDVQEAVEAYCKNIGGKLLFIGTGQTAVTGTANLKKTRRPFYCPLRAVRCRRRCRGPAGHPGQEAQRRPTDRAGHADEPGRNLPPSGRDQHRPPPGRHRVLSPGLSDSAGPSAFLGEHPAGLGPDGYRQSVAQPAEHDPQGHPDEPRCGSGPRHPRRLSVLRLGRQAPAGPCAAPQSSRADHEMDHGQRRPAADGPRLRSGVSDHQTGRQQQ